MTFQWQIQECFEEGGGGHKVQIRGYMAGRDGGGGNPTPSHPLLDLHVYHFGTLILQEN